MTRDLLVRLRHLAYDVRRSARWQRDIIAVLGAAGPSERALAADYLLEHLTAQQLSAIGPVPLHWLAVSHPYRDLVVAIDGDADDLKRALGEDGDAALDQPSRLEAVSLSGASGPELARLLSSEALRCATTLQLDDVQGAKALDELRKWPSLKRLKLGPRAFDGPSLAEAGQRGAFDAVTDLEVVGQPVASVLAAFPNVVRFKAVDANLGLRPRQEPFSTAETIRQLEFENLAQERSELSRFFEVCSCTSLEQLTIRHTELNDDFDEWIDTIAEQPLRHLDLEGTRGVSSRLTRFLSRTSWSLEFLRLSAFRLYALDTLATALARSSWRETLRELALANLPPGANGLDTLLLKPWPALEALTIGSGFDPIHVRKLVYKTPLPKLNRLGIAGNPLSDAAVAELVEAGLFDGHDELDLSGTRAGAATVQALLDGNLSERLETLRLADNGLTDHTAHILADSLLKWPRLRFLDVRANELSESGIRALESTFSPLLDDLHIEDRLGVHGSAGSRST